MSKNEERSKNSFLVLLEIRNLERKKREGIATEKELKRLTHIDKLFAEYEVALAELNIDFLKVYNEKFKDEPNQSELIVPDQKEPEKKIKPKVEEEPVIVKKEDVKKSIRYTKKRLSDARRKAKNRLVSP